MGSALLDVCRFTPTAGGTTDWTYSAAVTGYQSPAAAGAVNGATYSYRAESADLMQWEVGIGVYSSGTGVLTRATVLFNSSGTTSKINFSAVPQVAVVALKEDLISIEEANNFTLTQKARARANIDALKKNYILNGGMMVSQENGSSAVTTNGGYPADQWSINYGSLGTGTFTAQQIAAPSPGGSPNRLRLTVTTAQATVGGSLVFFAQPVEGYRAADLWFGTAVAKSTTFQASLKSPVSGTFLVQLINSAQDTVAQGFITIAPGEVNTDVIKSVTMAGPTTGAWLTNNGAGFYLRFFLMYSGQTANVFATNGNVFELSDVGLYEGNAAPSFQLPDFDDELRKCKRFWSKSYEVGTAPGAATTLGLVKAGMNDSAATGHGAIIFNTPMRAAPTVSYWDGNGNASKMSYPTSNTSTWNHNATINPGIFNVSQNGFCTGGPNFVPDVQAFIHYTANARL